jgi:HrpA-like RNA helicase
VGDNVAKLISDHCKKFPPQEDELSSVLQGEMSVVSLKPKKRTVASTFVPSADRWQKAQDTMVANPAYAKIYAGRERLPAWQYRDSVVSMVSENQVLLISGETGCGKTTQVPQFLLDSDLLGPTASIVCTQPR